MNLILRIGLSADSRSGGMQPVPAAHVTNHTGRRVAVARIWKLTERISLSGWGLFLLAAVLAAGGAATAALLHYVAHAPLPFVLLITCVSLPAMTLLFYIGFLIWTSPKTTGYLLPIKALAVLSVAMSLAIVMDFVMPVQSEHLILQAKVPGGQYSILHIGGYEQAVDARTFNMVHEGDRLAVKTTALFGRIESISAAGMSEPGYIRSTWDRIVMISCAAVFFVAVGALRFNPNKDEPARNLKAYFALIVPSYVLSLIAVGLWIKLILVHILQTVDKM